MSNVFTSKDQTSIEEFKATLMSYVDSGASIVHIRAKELMRALYAIRLQAIEDKCVYNEWDVINGFRTFTADNITNELMVGDGDIDFVNVLSRPLRDLRAPKATDRITYYVYVSPQPFMANNPMASQLITMYSKILVEQQAVVLLLTPDEPLPGLPEDTILSVRLNTPTHAELQDALVKIVDSVKSDFDDVDEVYDDSSIDEICNIGAGMTEASFLLHTSLSIIGAGQRDDKALLKSDIVTGLGEGKTIVVNSSEVLELYPTVDSSEIGGLERLKAWVRKRRNCYGDEAKRLNIDPPKGLVLVGPPGVGKSLTAKSIASEFGVPLIRLDFGRVFNSFVGASEQRMRQALKMIEDMAPIVVLCDEVDKGLGGIGSGGDSGISQRVLGTFLTWLNDNTAPVFTVVTANNVDGLPPEMLRRGRFDAIFSTTVPNPLERREVLKIHLRKRGYDIKDFPNEDVVEFINLSDGYVPAEIESAVKDGQIEAFSEDEDFSLRHVNQALRDMIPLSKAFEDKFTRMREWAEKNATPASEPYNPQAENVSPIGARRRNIRTKRND